MFYICCCVSFKNLIMKTILITLMIVQVALFALGTYYLSVGNLYLGLYHVVLTTAFFVVNIYTLKRVWRH